ncbi:hypothetical protein FOA43_001514 [Brettanomyces nanus]|uniref:Uncharacterized protein n=1 Tax=Eeniella nana TaxID=13502 RepID=A0A875RNV2_EENNA|nr:uncharacterized protein FOA43_001514 [Brettanomyces nanus]QPG74190.1 hypothetical protein FOA43_001514 [Brettanomyces nanus]
MSMSIDQVVVLVESLYAPSNDSQSISQIQTILQNIQKSDHGLSIADQLLEQPSLNCKFFGALTYTVNLNLQLPGLVSDDKDDTLTLLTTKLLQQLLVLVSDDSVIHHGGMFVIKKMLSNLALVYVSNYKHWKEPLTSYMCSIINSRAMLVPDDSSLLSDNDITHYLSKIPLELLSTVLMLSQIIVEEIIKKEVTNANQVEMHKVVHDYLFGTTERLLIGLTRLDNPLILSSWLECFSSWIVYASKAEFDSTIRYNMTPLLKFTINLMALPTPWQSPVPEKAMDTLIDVLDTNYTFFNVDTRKQLSSLIFGPWSSKFLGDMPELADQYARLCILFLEPDTVHLALKLNDDANDPNFDFLLRLTDFPGQAVVEETISSDFIDFWMQLSDSLLNDDDRFSLMLKDDKAKIERFNGKAKSLFIKISQIYWNKIHIPQDVAELEGYNNEFRVYRRDVGDLFESIFPIVRTQLYKNLVDNVLMNVNGSSQPALNDIEASLYLINAVSADFSENNVQKEILDEVSQILSSNYLELVTAYRDPNKFQHIVYTTIRFVSTIDWFYKSSAGLPYLPQILNFLFDTLVTCSMYQLISSKAIADICDNSRLSLQDSLPNFKEIIPQMINETTVEPLTRQRIVNSYASIVQGVKDPRIQGQYLHDIFSLLGKRSYEVILSLDSANNDDQDKMMDYLVSLISSVSAIGKGMQLPDSPDEVYTPEELKAVNSYWSQDPLKIHAEILEIVNNLSMLTDKLADNLSVAEEITSIFKSGMTESVGGPFVIDYSVIVEFVVAKFRTLKTTKTYPLLYGLYSNVIKSCHREMNSESVSQTLQIIYLDRLETIRSDPDIIQSVMKLFGTIISTTPSLLVGDSNMLEKVLEFGIEQLQSNERFVLQSLELFWTKLIYLRRGNHQNTMAVRRLFNETKLGNIVIYNVLKYMLLSQRSNLEFFTEILKSLVAKYPMLIKQWLLNSFKELNLQRVQSGQKTIKNYELFIKKILITRGTRAANGLIKDFWLEVNGLVDYNKKLTVL